MAKLTPASAAAPTNVGSNKSTPTPTVAAPKNVTKWVLLMVVAFAVIIGIALLVASIKRDRAKVAQAIPQYLQQTTTIPLASLPQSSWPKLAVPPGGKSEIIPLPSGMRVIWAGYQFRNYTVYPDGHECAFNGTTPCPNGSTGTYANNEANVVNVVAYAFDPI